MASLPKENPVPTQLGLHSVRNVLGEQNQISLFSEHDVKFSEEYGIKLSGSIARFGIDLTDMQMRIMEGILQGFSRTDYRGNLPSRHCDEVVAEKFGGKVPLLYKNISQLPRLRVKQSEILDWAGVNKSSIASWGRAVSALHALGTTQFCFYYDRLVYDENGNPARSHNGDWKKEQVYSVDTLFNIKEIREQSTGILKYYEITPSVIFLDQRESYFMLVPFNWREEVRSIYGNKKASGYFFLFILFLRYQYELKRRSKRVNLPYQIRWSPEEIARAIKIPEGTISKRKKQMLSILHDSYLIAEKLGYLTRVEILDHLHVLTLCNEKYSGSGELNIGDAFKKLGRSALDDEKMQVAKKILHRFHDYRRTLDPSHKNPEGNLYSSELSILMNLLETRNEQIILELIKWSVERKYWCSRLSTVSKLTKYFEEAYSEMEIDKRSSGSPEDNKKYIEELLNRYGKQFAHGYIEVLNKYVDFCTGQRSTCFFYDDKQFKEKVDGELKRLRMVNS